MTTRLLRLKLIICVCVLLRKQSHLRLGFPGGLSYLSVQRLYTRALLVQSIGSPRWQQCVLQHRALHCSRYPALNSSKAEHQNTTDRTQKATETTKNTSEQKKAEDEGAENDDGPEYIPRRKAKNPMMIIGYAWIIGLPSGVIGFILAKRQVDKNRLKQLKIRQRMKTANEGEYKRERYQTATGVE